MESRKFLFYFLIICFLMLIFSFSSEGHYVQTHQKMISLAKSNLSHSSPYDRIHTFLESADPSTGTTYLRFLMRGALDADKLVNGLYQLDFNQWNHCWDWDIYKNDSRCYPNITLPNEITISQPNIRDWPVGDHGYNPSNQKGFCSLITNEELETSKAENPAGYNSLLAAISNLFPVSNPELKLKELLDSSNAKSMAIEFFNRATREWKLNNFQHAMYNLGISLHVIQDMTVPYHTLLIGGLDHDEYEKYTWEQTLYKGKRELSVKGDYSFLSIQAYVDNNATQSQKFSKNPAVSSETSVLIGIDSTIGVLTTFFQ